MQLNVQQKSELRSLEESLWIATTRFDREYMERILAPDFFEFGRSGKRYTRNQILGFESGELNATIPLENLTIHSLDKNSVLVTYISEVLYNTVQRSNRTSIWLNTPSGWQLRFHQGTPLLEPER